MDEVVSVVVGVLFLEVVGEGYFGGVGQVACGEGATIAFLQIRSSLGIPALGLQVPPQFGVLTLQACYFLLHLGHVAGQFIHFVTFVLFFRFLFLKQTAAAVAIPPCLNNFRICHENWHHLAHWGRWHHKSIMSFYKHFKYILCIKKGHLYVISKHLINARPSTLHRRLSDSPRSPILQYFFILRLFSAHFSQHEYRVWFQHQCLSEPTTPNSAPCVHFLPGRSINILLSSDCFQTDNSKNELKYKIPQFLKFGGETPST